MAFEFTEKEVILPVQVVPDVFKEIHSFAAERNETERYAPTMEIQAAQIREEFLNIPELQYDNWKELSIEQRIDALNDMEQKVAEIAKRDPMQVVVEPMRGGVMGYFDGTKLAISEKSLMKSDYFNYMQTMDTLFHEGRHAYQRYNMVRSKDERAERNDSLVHAWQDNHVLGYRGQTFEIKNWGFMRYQEQPVEVDARVFAERILQELEITPSTAAKHFSEKLYGERS